MEEVRIEEFGVELGEMVVLKRGYDSSLLVVADPSLTCSRSDP